MLPGKSSVFVYMSTVVAFFAAAMLSVHVDGAVVNGRGDETEVQTAPSERTEVVHPPCDEDTIRLARARLINLKHKGIGEKAIAEYQKRIRHSEDAVKALHRWVERWNGRVVSILAKQRGLTLDAGAKTGAKTGTKANEANKTDEKLGEFPLAVFNRYHKYFVVPEESASSEDQTKLSPKDKRLLECYYKYRLGEFLSQFRDETAVPCNQEDLIIPVVQSLIVTPLLTFTDSGFAVPPEEFLPAWSKRPYYVTKMVEFCVLSADNMAAAKELHRFLRRETANPDYNYDGSFHEHLAMIYRRNGMVGKALKEIEAALDASRSASMGSEHELRLRTLLVEGYEETQQYDEAGKAAFDIVANLGNARVDRRSYRKTLERAKTNLEKADNLDWLSDKLDELIGASVDSRYQPDLLRQKWSLLRQRGGFYSASEVLHELSTSFPRDEQTGWCHLDVAKDCLGSGRYEDFETVIDKILRDFPEDWVAVEAAELRRKWKAGSEHGDDDHGKGGSTR